MDKSSNTELVSNVNYVHVIGKVIKEVTPSHLFDNKMHYFLRLEVDHGDKRPDIIQAFVPEDKIMTPDGHIIDIGNTVEIEGYLVHTKIEGKFDVSVLVDDIKIVDDATQHTSILYIEGKIFKSYELKKTKDKKSGIDKFSKNIILRHNSSRYEGMYLTLKANTWNSLAQRLDSNYAEGDTILIKGKLKSREVTGEKNTLHLHEVRVNVLIDRKEDAVEEEKSEEEPTEEVNESQE